MWPTQSDVVFKHFLLARSGVCIFVFSCVVFLFGCFFSALNSLGGSSLFLVTGRIGSVNNQQSFRRNKKHISQQLFIYLYRKRNCFFQPTQPKGIIYHEKSSPSSSCCCRCCCCCCRCRPDWRNSQTNSQSHHPITKNAGHQRLIQELHIIQLVDAPFVVGNFSQDPKM